MTELLFMKNCYLKEFDANVTKQGDGYVVLDKTAFYPEGGGQPSDVGWLNDTKVKGVKKVEGEVRHYVAAPLTGAVHGKLDWADRYPYMRFHTAQHLLSAIVLDKYGAETCGNQIKREGARIDFTLDRIDDEMKAHVVKRFNELVDHRVPVKIYFTTRDEMMKSVDERRRKLFARVPETVTEVRIVEIEGVDKCPCAGTHVANTTEIGHITIANTENKGAGKTRVSFTLSGGERVL